MDINEQQTEAIERYLEGKMSAEEGKIFVQELGTNTELKQAFDLEYQIRHNPVLLAQHENRDAIRSMIRQAGNEWESENLSEQKTAPVKRMPLRKISWMAAASFILLASAWLLYTVFLDQGPHSAESLYAEYFQKDPIPFNTPPQLENELNQYQQGNNQPIQDLVIDDIPVERGEGDDYRVIEMAYYFKGLSYAETNNFSNAVTNLQWVIDNARQNELRTKAQWYLALVMMKTGKSKQAQQLLQAVATTGNAPHREKAVALLRKLQK